MRKFFWLALIAITVAACTTPGAKTNGEFAMVKHGIVVAMEPVTLAGHPTGTGAMLGATVGTVAGANVALSAGGDFKTALVGVAVGQVLGAMSGHEVEKMVSESDGFVIAVQLDGGEEVTVAQRAEDTRARQVQVGSRVRVIGSAIKATVELERE